MGVNREHRATDAYPAWKATIAAAQDSVVIFTPYFDALLERLIKPSVVDVTVVTDMSPTSGARDYLPQLRSILNLLNGGVEVRHLERLHAKVLWSDGGTVIYGSQNFTTYARSSKEVTHVSRSDLTKTEVTQTLQSWLEESTPIDVELVEFLLANAQAPAAVLMSAHEELLKAHESALAEYTQPLEHHYEKRVHTSPSTMSEEEFSRLTASVGNPQGQAFLTPKEIEERGAGVGGSYMTMMADPDQDLTQWFASDGDGSARIIDLAHLSMHPALFTDSGRMAFLRVGKTRITYARFGVRYTTRPVLIESISGVSGDSSVEAVVELRFPSDVDETGNIEMTFDLRDVVDNLPLGKVHVGAHFTGDDIDVQDLRTPESKHANEAGVVHLSDKRAKQRELMVASLFVTPETRANFFRRQLTSFTYSELGIEDKNAHEIFLDAPYELAVTEYANTPVLLLRQHEPWPRILKVLDRD